MSSAMVHLSVTILARDRGRSHRPYLTNLRSKSPMIIRVARRLHYFLLSHSLVHPGHISPWYTTFSGLLNNVPPFTLRREVGAKSRYTCRTWIALRITRQLSFTAWSLLRHTKISNATHHCSVYNIPSRLLILG